MAGTIAPLRADADGDDENSCGRPPGYYRRLTMDDEREDPVHEAPHGREDEAGPGRGGAGFPGLGAGAPRPRRHPPPSSRAGPMRLRGDRGPDAAGAGDGFAAFESAQGNGVDRGGNRWTARLLLPRE